MPGVHQSTNGTTISGSITESQVTSLVTDLAAKATPAATQALITANQQKAILS